MGTTTFSKTRTAHLGVQACSTDRTKKEKSPPFANKRTGSWPSPRPPLPPSPSLCWPSSSSSSSSYASPGASSSRHLSSPLPPPGLSRWVDFFIYYFVSRIDDCLVILLGGLGFGVCEKFMSGSCDFGNDSVSILGKI